MGGGKRRRMTRVVVVLSASRDFGPASGSLYELLSPSAGLQAPISNALTSRSGACGIGAPRADMMRAGGPRSLKWFRLLC